MGALAEGDKSSKSLLANVLDKNDDYILPSNLPCGSVIDRPSGYIDEYGFPNCKDCSKQYFSQGLKCDVHGCNGNNVVKNLSPIQELHPPITKQADYILPYIKCKCNLVRDGMLKKELEAILHEIQFITDKYRDEVKNQFGYKNSLKICDNSHITTN